MGLKEQRAKARASLYKTRTEPKEPKGLSEYETRTLAALEAVLDKQERLLESLSLSITEQHKTLSEAISKPITVESSEVDVHLPEPAKSYRVEYGQDGRPHRLIREFERTH